MNYFCSLLLALFAFNCCTQASGDTVEKVKALKTQINMTESNKSIDTATFAAGCFWCIEAQFLALKGVQSVKSGYTGGKLENPTYEEVCSGTTGHAEAITVVFDPAVLNYESLLVAFFLAHDPTQLNRQGNDVGTQYRSAIFPRSEHQKEVAEKYIAEMNNKNLYGKPIVTTIEPLTVFYEAENYHDDYFAKNPQNPYCQSVVRPKLEKFKEIFNDDLK